MAPRHTTAMDGGSSVFAGAKNCPFILNIHAPCHQENMHPAFSNKLRPCSVMAPRHTVHPEHKKTSIPIKE